MSGGLLVILGVIYLLVDLGVWGFWGIQWWTALLLFAGATVLATRACKDCQACNVCMPTTKSKKK